MNCWILFSRENKKSIISLSSDEFAHSMVSVTYSSNSILQDSSKEISQHVGVVL